MADSPVGDVVCSASVERYEVVDLEGGRVVGSYVESHVVAAEVAHGAVGGEDDGASALQDAAGYPLGGHGRFFGRRVTSWTPTRWLHLPVAGHEHVQPNRSPLTTYTVSEPRTRAHTSPRDTSLTKMRPSHKYLRPLASIDSRIA